jgi:chromosome segregation ATPase
VLVRSDCCGFNILKFGGRFYAVSQQLGPLDLASSDIGMLRASRDVFVADSQSDAELLAQGLEGERSLRRIRELESEIASQDLVLAQRQTEVAQLTEQMAATCRQHEARLNDAAKAFDLQAQLVESLRAVGQQYEIRVTDAQQRLHDLEVRPVATLELKRQQYEARVSEAQQQIAARDAAIQEGRDGLAAIRSQLEQTSAALEVKSATHERLRLEMEEMRSWIDELQRRLVVATRQRGLFRWLRRT